MDLVKKNTALSQFSYQPLGLGWSIFGKKIPIGKWLKKASGFITNRLKSIAEDYIPLFGEDIGKQLQEWQGALDNVINDTPGLNGADDGMTTDEENYLNVWMADKFTPFCGLLLIEIGSAMDLPTQQAQVVALNSVLNRIDGAQDYYAVDEVGFLSQIAIDQRNYLVYKSFEPIFNAVQKAVTALGLNVTTKKVQFAVTNYDFTPLFKTTIVTVVQGENYVLNGTSSGTVKFSSSLSPLKSGSMSLSTLVRKPTTTTTAPVNTGVVFPVSTPIKTAAPVITAPVDQMPVKTSPVTTVDTPVINLPINTTPVATTVDTPATTPVASGNKTDDDTPETKGNGMLWLGGALLIAAAIVASRKKKKTSGSTAAKTQKSKS